MVSLRAFVLAGMMLTATMFVDGRAGDCGVDLEPPRGAITAPGQGTCHGPLSLLVAVEDDFADDCDPELERRYLPPGGEQRLLGHDSASFDRFGLAVAMASEVAVVGAPFARHPDLAHGAAYVFRRHDGAWLEEARLAVEESPGLSFFGRSVAGDGDWIAVGDSLDLVDSRVLSGSVYVFRYVAEAGWVQEAELTPRDGKPFDRFGISVAIAGDTLVAGAFRDDDRGPDAGAAYVFRRDADGWFQEAKLVAGDGAPGDKLGLTVTIDGDVIVVGAPGDDDRGAESGSAYVFRRSGTGWIEEAKLTAADSTRDACFGCAISAADGVIVIGAERDVRVAGRRSGSAYVFRRAGSTWALEQRLVTPRRGTGDRFGSSVAIEGNTIVVGARGHGGVNETGPGAAFVFVRDGSRWVDERKLAPTDGVSLDNFGGSVAVGDGMILIGAKDDDDRGTSSGSVYAYNGSDALYARHGDWNVSLEVADDTGNEASDAVAFTIDLEPPTVTLTVPDSNIALGAEIPLASLFQASDDDQATGGVTVERMFFEDCLVLDGRTFGDGDGLLSDEVAVFDQTTLCEAAKRCGLSGFSRPVLRVEAEDCGHNVGAGSTEVLMEPALDCG